jgi:hypothetical protein
MKLLNIFLFLWVIFALLDLDPDPLTWLNPDPIQNSVRVSSYRLFVNNFMWSGANFSCTCGPGLEGATCEVEVDECGSAPCTNGGTCTDLRADYACACPPGFTGKSCQVDVNECESSPCQHGSCSDLVSGGTVWWRILTVVMRFTDRIQMFSLITP